MKIFFINTTHILKLQNIQLNNEMNNKFSDIKDLKERLELAKGHPVEYNKVRIQLEEKQEELDDMLKNIKGI